MGILLSRAKYYRIITLGLTLAIGRNFGPSMTYEV
jgi:hypothetical protein